jgi:REP element-mobilizing transposase RayT
MPAQMAYKKDYAEEYYHVYNKGVDDKIVFNDSEDYSAFLGFLQEYLTPFNPESYKKEFVVKGRGFMGLTHQPKNYFNKIELLAYSLSPNHFHLILRQIEDGSLVGFMRSLSTRYSIYFNRKNKRKGSLFEGAYKSVKIFSTSQLCLLVCYLHQEGSHTSHPEYSSQRQTAWINSDIVLSYLRQNDINYQDIIQNHKFNETEEQLLKTISLENTSQSSSPSSNRKEEPIPIPKYKPRILEFSFLTTAFVALLTLSLLNIQKTSIINKNIQLSQSETSKVLSESDEQVPNPTPTALENTPTPVQPSVFIKEPGITSMVRINDKSKNVNILKKPSYTAEIIENAFFGEMYELINITNGWCEVKLGDGSIGFIPSNYIDVVNNITNN